MVNAGFMVVNVACKNTGIKIFFPSTFLYVQRFYMFLYVYMYVFFFFLSMFLYVYMYVFICSFFPVCLNVKTFSCIIDINYQLNFF